MHGKSGDTVNRGPVNRGMTVLNKSPVYCAKIQLHAPYHSFETILLKVKWCALISLLTYLLHEFTK